MYVVKNAWKSIVRSKGRNILIGIVVVLIAVSSCVALAIRSSADKVVENFKETNDITATVRLDRMAMMRDAQTRGADIREALVDIPTLTIEEIKKYGTSKYLKDYYYTIEATLDAKDIEPVDISGWISGPAIIRGFNNPDRNQGGNQEGTQGGNQGGIRNPFRDFQGPVIMFGNFRVRGYSSTSAMTEFVNGTCKITEGSMFEDGETGNVCVITDELAKLNDLTVGSKITFTNLLDETKTYEFTVVGIYTDTSSGGDSRMFQNPFSDSANTIITNADALYNIVREAQELSESSGSGGNRAFTNLINQVTPTFILKDPDSVDAFREDLEKMGLNQYFTLETNLDAFKESLRPINNLTSFATTFLLLVLAIGSVILIVINFINIRERKYEIGVLRAIGMKKHKVALQFVSELFIVTFIAFIVGSAIGSAASVPTANFMLKNQFNARQEQQQRINRNFGRFGEFGDNRPDVRSGSGIFGPRFERPAFGRFQGINEFFGLRSGANYITQINAVINAEVIAQMALIGILLVLFSSSVAIIFILRFEPLKILSNRS